MLIEYICKECGKKETRSPTQGMPQPGTCPRSSSKGAHHWKKNRDNSSGQWKVC